MGIFDNQQIGVAICTPHRKVRLANGAEVVESVSVAWHRARNALSFGTNINTIEVFADGMEVGEARDNVVQRILQHEPRPLYTFFLDNDVIPDWNAFTKLFYRAKTHPECDIFAGVYAAKTLAEPLVYVQDGVGPFWDWCVGDILTTDSHGVTGCHSGLTLVRNTLYQRMLDRGIVNDKTPFYKTVREVGRNPNGCMQSRSGTEDLWFCALARQAGAKFLIDTSVLGGHYDKNTGITWGLPEDSPPAKRARWLGGKDRKEADQENLKLAIDLGAGGTRRQWDGYRTYTLDARPESKPDYCQDLRWLNLPDCSYDLVASSHAFEHVPRWEQEKVWSEAFRICKPGGRLEVIVPNLAWAAAKIADGQCDEHVLNVLYGAQELHGYERLFNLHYFGYTPQLAQALAQNAGFINVTTEDWQTRPELGYNLIIRGHRALSGDGVQVSFGGEGSPAG